VSGAGKGKLGVLVDGEAMGEEDARAFWGRFSTWMDANKGDLAGFAKAEGFASVHPTMQDGRAVLVASRSATQKAYTNAPTVKSGLVAPGKKKGPSSGGSSAPQPPRNSGPHQNGIASKPPKR
jgi:hypothetical protein